MNHEWNKQSGRTGHGPPETPRGGVIRLKQRTWGPATRAERTRARGDAVCTRCDAVLHRKRWTVDRHLHEQLSLLTDLSRVLCPGCAAQVHEEIEGIVTVRALWNEQQREAVVHMLRNEEQAQIAKDPRGRIVSIDPRADGLELTVTSEFLARHLARSIAHMCQGREGIHQAPGEKFVQISVEC